MARSREACSQTTADIAGAHDRDLHRPIVTIQHALVLAMSYVGRLVLFSDSAITAGNGGAL